LNGNIFSTTCWGLSQWSFARMYIFLALAALASGYNARGWLKAALAGLCTGLAVMEGFDVAALHSIVVGLFAFCTGLFLEGVTVKSASKSLLRTAVVTLMAGWVAAHGVYSLIGTQVTGIAGTGQDEQSKKARWDYATQWSLPKKEALRVLVPGLFGYRMETPNGGNYWGFVGQDPSIERGGPGSFYRYSGSGEYAGVLVVLIAGLAVVQLFRRNNPSFSPVERKQVWFWAITGLACLLFAFGRHAPFYQFLYKLPYFSTIRNPIKFMHLAHLALLVLFGFGLQALFRCYLEAAETHAMPIKERLRQWWKSAAAADKRTALGYFVAFGVSVIIILIYAASRKELEQFLQKVGFPDPRQAAEIAGFSAGEALLFGLFFALSLAALVLVWSGFFSGRRAWAGIALLGLILAGDLMRANGPWVLYFDYKDRYAMNPVIEFLKQQPHEKRIVSLFLPINQQVIQIQSPMQALYSKEWLEHLFPFYNIQTLDVPQIPRMPEDYEKLRETFGRVNLFPRYWQLTSTRYVVTLAGLVDSLNNELDPAQRRFRVRQTFDVQPEDLTIVVKTNGQFGLVEFTGALPKASLYTNWEVSTNDAQTLKKLADPAFDPARVVLVSEAIPGVAPGTNNPAATNAGSVTIIRHAPKRVEVYAKVNTPCLLLYNDRFTPDWKLILDKAPAKLLRCNFIMRGVYLTPGNHEIVFHYEPPYRSLYASLAGLGVGLLILVFLLFGKKHG
jgi:hypothetical protein